MDINKLALHYSELIWSRYSDGEWCNCPTCTTKDIRELIDEMLLLAGDIPFLAQKFQNVLHPDYSYNPYDRQNYNQPWDGRIHDAIWGLVDQIWSNIERYDKIEDPVYCVKCGNLHDEKETIQVPLDFFDEEEWNTDDYPYDYAYLCGNCQSDVRVCEDCDEAFRSTTGHRLNSYSTADELSENTRWYRAPAYQGPTNNYNSTKMVCDTCLRNANKYRFCNCCHTYYQRATMPLCLYGVDYNPFYYVCEHCMADKEVVCDTCGDICYSGLDAHEQRKFFYSDRRVDNGGTRPSIIGCMIYHECNDCTENGRCIHNYEWKPKPKWKYQGKRSNDTLFYGCEFEAELNSSYVDRESMAEEFAERWDKNMFYIKSDSSLNYGWEIVSHPYTWEYYRKDRKTWDSIIEWLKNESSYDNTTYANCGLHFHMTKAAFSTFHLFKFVKFFYDKKNRKFIQSIAQRDNMEYARFYDSDIAGVKKIAKQKCNVSNERHSAINLTNPVTVEVRIFGNYLEPLKFHKNMEFLQSLFEFSRDASIKSLSLRDYMRFVRHKKQMPRFRSLIEFTSNLEDM